MFRTPPAAAPATARPSEQMATTTAAAAPAVPSDSSTGTDLPTSAASTSTSAPLGDSENAQVSFIKSLMDQNPYFSAGAGLMGITAGLAVGRRLITLGTTLAQRRMLVSLEISSKDHAYPWFLEWMAVNSQQIPPGSLAAGNGPLSILRDPTGWWNRIGQLKGIKSHELSVETSYKKHENGASEALFSLVPGPGTHWFKYQGAWMQVKRDRSQKQMDMHNGSPWETLTLTTLSRDRELFPDLLSEARALAQQGEEGKTVVYTAWGVEWRPFGKPRRRREMGSVVLDRGVSEHVEGDLLKFLRRGKWYAERGIPYRRGYLLHGPPGSGKSSYIQALAGSLGYNICLLNLSERGMTDDKLALLLSLVPERSLVLLEDVDAAFSKRSQTSEDGYQSSITFSGLLNTLDGVASSDSRIIFMTTNHLSRLDPALVRPGRVDVVAYLGDASAYQASELFRRFYGSSTSASIRPHKGVVGGDGDGDGDSDGNTGGDEWSAGNRVNGQVDERAALVGRFVLDKKERSNKAISMAALQGLFIRCEVDEVERQLEGLFEERAVEVDTLGAKVKPGRNLKELVG
ncbi:AAA-type ATPase [Phaffia rhodozyma]|uniref:AAA-type ATPase n=1 Tax=Phaffia rhodozyma TaxID=264483 RepID=A0A0F7SQ95_PHARH|nr:AAA-type ATPase [Phaffia rhodozyma]